MYQTTVRERRVSPDYNYHGFDACPIFGQPGKLFLCILADNSYAYAGIIPQGEIVINASLTSDDQKRVITGQEHSDAFMEVSGKIELEHHFPHGVENEPDDLYRQNFLNPAWEIVESVSYWLLSHEDH